jgi:hypothetical protein
MVNVRRLAVALLIYAAGVLSGIIIHAHHWPR